MSAQPLVAAIIVPTHDHAATLDLAVRSALEQTVANVQVVVIGDGVGDDTRQVMAGLGQEDARVRFLDMPKGPHHGEIYRGQAVEDTAAEIVCYLCDDDLLLPEHVENMADLLADHDLAQSLNGYVDENGSWHSYFGDLASPECRAWILRPDRNAVSLTGTAHTASAYRRLPHGWRTTPPGVWADHYMWQQFLAEPWVRAITATQVTALQFPSHYEGRDDWSPEARRAELEKWRQALAEPRRRDEFDEAVRRTLVAESAAGNVTRDTLYSEVVLRDDWIAELQEHVAMVEGDRVLAQAEAESAILSRQQVQEQLAATRIDLEAVRAEMARMSATRTWRVRSRLVRLPPVQSFARARAARKT